MAAFDQILSFARDNDAAGIRQLVQMGCPPSYCNRMGQTALHIGAIWGSVEAVKALLEAGGNPNAQNQLRGSTPLHAAAMGKGPVDRRAECVRLIIQFKGDPRKADFGGELPLDAAGDEALRLALGAAPLVLHKAVQARNVKALQDAVEQVRQGVVDLDLESLNPGSESALHLAVALNWREGVELLLSARADPNSPNTLQRAPLHTAVLRGNHRHVELLIQAGADVNAKDADPEHDPQFKSTSFEEKPYDHRTPLHYAAELGSVPALRLLLQARADANATDSKWQTPLHLCLALRSPDTELEVGSGVRVTGLQKRPEWNGLLGSTLGPRAAADDGSAARWPVLLEGSSEGVLLKEENLERLPEETLDLLLAASADVNRGNQVFGETCTLLHEAARLGDVALARKLLSAGAEVNRQEQKLGFAALHLAARARHAEMARLLVEAAADLGLRTAAGRTAAELAEKNGLEAPTLALLRGEVLLEPKTVAKGSEVHRPQTLEDLTPEQRALMFLD